jgi:hypothetical protein
MKTGGSNARGCDAVVTARAFYYILPAGGRAIAFLPRNS